MKRTIIAALAVAALAGCNKQEEAAMPDAETSMQESMPAQDADVSTPAAEAPMAEPMKK